MAELNDNRNYNIVQSTHTLFSLYILDNGTTMKRI